MSSAIRVSHGLWRDPSEVADLAGRVSALLSVCPEGTVVSGVTAARLHGLWLPPGLPDRVEVIVHPDIGDLEDRPGGRRRELRARRQHLRPDEVTASPCGFVLTTEARTWIDLADRLVLGDLVALGDSALRGTATTRCVQDQIVRARHRRGVVLARAAEPLLDARSRSRPESRLRCALVTSGLPRPAVNEPIHDCHGGWVAEPDLSYDDVQLAIEYNGADHAEVPRMQRDITRTLDVEGRGRWRVVTFGPQEVFGNPDRAVAHVRRLRAEQAVLLGLPGATGRSWAWSVDRPAAWPR